jgi:hypothetical protein
MRARSCAISSCRHCVFYESQGRRGGQCRQLGVPVQGSWKSCSLAMPPFAAPTWEEIEPIFDPIIVLRQQALEVQLTAACLAVPRNIPSNIHLDPEPSIAPSMAQ